nr:5146_t:CDS:2 [Entrophospora candida]
MKNIVLAISAISALCRSFTFRHKARLSPEKSASEASEAVFAEDSPCHKQGENYWSSNLGRTEEQEEETFWFELIFEFGTHYQLNILSGTNGETQRMLAGIAVTVATSVTGETGTTDATGKAL